MPTEYIPGESLSLYQDREARVLDRETRIQQREVGVLPAPKLPSRNEGDYWRKKASRLMGAVARKETSQPEAMRIFFHDILDMADFLDGRKREVSEEEVKRNCTMTQPRRVGGPIDAHHRR